MNVQRALCLCKRIKPSQVSNVFNLPLQRSRVAVGALNLNQLQFNSLILTRQVSTIEKNVNDSKDGFISKLLMKVPFLNMTKNKLNVRGYILYESIADGIDYVKYFKEFGLKDSFYSWFVITELHVWMLLVRSMVEGDEGRILRNCIVHALWEDVRLRSKKVSLVNPSEVRYQITELSEQFQAALLAYDEGLQTDDTILAAALWRRFYQQRDVDPENLEKLVKYIRKQTSLLDKISEKEFFSMKPIKWEGI